MSSKLKKAVNELEKQFNVPLSEVKKIIKDFHGEMSRGLAGQKSSLKMIPTYVDKPSGGEKGKFLALDLGGTNFRILEVELRGRGQLTPVREKKLVLDKKYVSGKGENLFNFLAHCIKDFSKEPRSIGFTFSFPVKQTGIAEGRLLHWTKDFSAKGVVGKDVVKLLSEALLRSATYNKRIAALVNDTVGTLAAHAYHDEDCDIAVILGTGTNACYQEEVNNISKWRGPIYLSDRMIINIEWGGFNKLRSTPFDILLDDASENPGAQILEKMVSGMYLGEIVRFIIRGLINKKIIFEGKNIPIFNEPKGFIAEYISRIEADRSPGLLDVNAFLKNKGIRNSTGEEREALQKICHLVSKRGARISAAALAAVLTKIDPKFLRAHTVAVDGSLYEKHPNFAKNIRLTLQETFGRRASRVRMALAKDGSGRGAAIIAAIATSL